MRRDHPASSVSLSETDAGPQVGRFSSCDARTLARGFGCHQGDSGDSRVLNAGTGQVAGGGVPVRLTPGAGPVDDLADLG